MCIRDRGATIQVAPATSKPDPVYNITGTVYEYGGTTPAQNASVTLKLGAAVVSRTTTDAQGGYVFGGVPTGLYNVVAEHSDLTMTILVALTGDADEKDITLPEAGKNSVVEVKENTPPVVVGGVEEVAESQTDSSGSLSLIHI